MTAAAARLRPAPPAPETEAAVEDARWTEALGDPEALAAEAAGRALAAAGVAAEGLGVSVLFAGDAAVAALNARFRGKAGPTNVLSFPAEDLRPSVPGAAPRPPARGSADGEAAPLGDLALAYGTCAAEAAAARLPLAVHALHLVLHGTLHLLGFDHEDEADAARMEDLESHAMLAAGLPDPYLAQLDQEGRQRAAPPSDGSDGR